MVYNKLRGKIREVFGTQEAFALGMGMSCSTISKKLNNSSDWSVSEIQRACAILSIPAQKAHEYFFTL